MYYQHIKPKRGLVEDIITSISIAVVEIELLSSPFWLGYVIFYDLSSISGYSPAWIFGYWISAASYIGIKRIVSIAGEAENWLRLNTLTNILISVLVYGGAGIIIIHSTISLNMSTNSFLLALVFCIFSSILLFRSFEVSIIYLEKLAGIRSGA